MFISQRPSPGVPGSSVNSGGLCAYACAPQRRRTSPNASENKELNRNLLLIFIMSVCAQQRVKYILLSALPHLKIASLRPGLTINLAEIDKQISDYPTEVIEESVAEWRSVKHPSLNDNFFGPPGSPTNGGSIIFKREARDSMPFMIAPLI